MSPLYRRLGYVLIFVLILCLPALAEKLVWDAPTTNADGTPLTDLAGYKVYRGPESGVYDSITTIGNVTEYELTGLIDSQYYYFTVTAYDLVGNESAKSNEVVRAPPEPGQIAAATNIQVTWHEVIQSMANGFQTSRPSRHGYNTSPAVRTAPYSQKFVCPETGTQEITEIGLYCAAYAGYTPAFHLAIFDHDAGNDCPSTIVANSDSGELTQPSTDVGVIYHTYATKPQLTGGNTYWLVFYVYNSNDAMAYDRIVNGESSLYLQTFDYPNWPADATWHTHTDSADDLGIYAVYSAAGGLSIPGNPFRKPFVRPFGGVL